MSKGQSRQEDRRIVRKRLNRSNDPSSRLAHGYGNTYHFAETRHGEAL